MEAAAVYEKARQYNVPFYCIRVVTDTAPKAFRLISINCAMRTADSAWPRSCPPPSQRPAVFPALMKLNKRSKDAARALGDFIADTRF